MSEFLHLTSFSSCSVTLVEEADLGSTEDELDEVHMASILDSSLKECRLIIQVFSLELAKRNFSGSSP